MTTTTLSVQGPLTTTEVIHWRKKLLSQPAHDWPTTISLEEVSRCDSSALALLLELKTIAADHQRTLIFTHAPKSMLTLARLTGVNELLDWPASSNSADTLAI